MCELNPLGVDVFYNLSYCSGSIIRDLQRADMVLIGGQSSIRDELTKIYNDIQVTEPKINFMTAKARSLNCNQLFLTTKIRYQIC